MPDLSQQASSQYWAEFIDPSIYKVITFMESVETNTLDGDQSLEAAMMELGMALDDVEGIDFNLLSAEEQFMRIVGNIKTGRGLRLLQAIDTMQPGSASKVLMHAEQSSQSSFDSAGLFLQRNIIFERLRLLTRVFSAYRLQLVQRALEGDE